MLESFLGFTRFGVIPGISSNDPSLSVVLHRDYKLFSLSKDLGHPTWNDGGGELCKALSSLSSDTTTCWLSMEIIHTYEMNEVRTCFLYVTLDEPSGDVHQAGIHTHKLGKRTFSHLI